MPDASEYQSDFEAAEAAATTGDFARAEALLRRGLARQEAIRGSAHPDVASTLNNLAVVCETLGRIDDAERFYRRAHAVASATRPADDPLVTTSLANLQDFCRAHGRRTEETAPPTAAFEPPRASAPAAMTRQAARPPVAGSTPAPATPAVPATARVPRGFATALFLVAAVATAAVSWLWLRPTVPATPAASVAPSTATPEAGSAPTPRAPDPAPAPPAHEAERPPAATAPPAPAAPAASAPVPERSAALVQPSADNRDPAGPSAGGVARVMSSDLCETLETRGRAWRCEPLAAPASPGRVSFVTRVASAVPLRVQHRWSRDGAVRQTVRLSVAASPADGYRTYSRQTVTPGSWTVALVDASGTVLREVSFEVR